MIKTGFKVTHDDLVKAGSRWLKKFGCGVVFEEFKSNTSEIPDVIAWKSGYSFLIECKISRSDFLADFQKPHRIDPSFGMGEFRLYLCPDNLINPEELPDGWGLLYYSPDRKYLKRVICFKGNTVYKHKEYGIKKFDANFGAERAQLLSRIRRKQLGYGGL